MFRYKTVRVVALKAPGRTEELELVVALLLDLRRVAAKLDRQQPLVYARTHALVAKENVLSGPRR